ncbi:hypothetical protein DFJ74DRAFT_654131 [Hyaloraphidium curvatum]|nr:hypothetical protein DFJ74DRAFT_654131 [Hyaloraphidium curvatum]
MRLRIRAPSGVHTLGAALLPSSPLAALRAEAAAVAGIPEPELVLKAGFPPRVLGGEGTLEAAGVKDGEQLVAERGAGGGNASAGPGAASAPPAPPPAASNPFAAPPAPPAASSPAPAPPKAPGTDEAVPFGHGFLVPREQADDNSCLFRSVAFVCTGSASSHAELRRVVADAVLKDPDEYSEAVLGRTPAAYASWITQKNSWGGAIELAILSAHFRREICSVDVSTLRVDRFGEGREYPARVLVMYSGIHYDAIALTPDPALPPEFDQLEFPLSEGDAVVDAAARLAAVWQRKRKFTDTARFTLKCGVCGKGMVGEKEATAHAKATGHAEFTEY